MRDEGLDKASIQEFETSNRRVKGHFYGFRKMFWNYLNKLVVPFYDSCCPKANGSTDETFISPVRYVTVDTISTLQAYNGTAWAAVNVSAVNYSTVAQNDIAAGTGGAIPVTNYLTTINTDAGGDAFTLADGTQGGQMKKILLVVDGGGDGVVTPATPLVGGTTITFGDVGDYVILIWDSTNGLWVVIENSGTVIA